MRVSDYFAELFVAGRFADSGWNVCFPHRDEGFDFIAVKPTLTGPLIRPVQVKGKYPIAEKGDKLSYDYVGRLTQTHPEMVLVIPYFSKTNPDTAGLIAYMPFSLVKPHTKSFRCQPAKFSAGIPAPRRDYERFFNASGLALLELPEWNRSIVQPPSS